MSFRGRIRSLPGTSRSPGSTSSGIQPAPAGVPQIDVMFEIDADGILKVSAKDATTGMNREVEIRASSGLTKGEIDDIIKRSEARPESVQTPK